MSAKVTATLDAVDVGTEIYVARDGKALGEISISDSVRPEAKRAIELLGHMGMRIILHTGDTRAVAGKVAHDLGIPEVEAELLPEGKLSRVTALVHDGRVVAMLGDGIRTCCVAVGSRTSLTTSGAR